MATKMTGLYGRTAIYTNQEEITSENVVEVVQRAYGTHQTNVSQINYLYNYYKGDQPINTREKTIRDDIINMIVENRAKQIVDFKVGYQFGEPVQYISTGLNDVNQEIAQLNVWMSSEEMEAKNVELGEWQAICGTAYKIALQKDSVIYDGEAPFLVYVPEPQSTFVIYSSGLGHKPMAGVYYITNDENEQVFNVYTDTEYFKIVSGEIIERGRNGLGMIPIIEYPNNSARIGAFEPVLDLLDALNELDSDRLDGVEQFIQSLVIALNCEFEDGQTFADIVKSGIVSLKSVDGMQQDIKILSEQLNQSQSQTLKDDYISSIIQISAMPNRNGGYSTSDTGIAVVYRDGWSAAEADAKKNEMPFKRSERQFLEIILEICRTTGGLDLYQQDIDIHFDRRNYENIEMKAQVLTQLLSSDKIAPRLAFLMSNMFPDAEAAYEESLPYIEKANTAESPSE